MDALSVRPLKPQRLKKGDLIALVSPAGIPTPADKVEKSVRYLEGLGFRVKLGQHVLAEWGYLAGTDQQRAADFNEMILNREVRAIFATRGGYGSPRILPLINYGALRRSPKIISGFSDITALQLALYKKCGLVTFSGPMPAVEFWKNPDPYTEENFWRLLTSAKKPAALRNPQENSVITLRAGKVAGVLLGGNLSLVASTLGTRFFPALREALVVLEEVGESPYRVDRMLTQLANAMAGAAPAGLLLGQFTNCDPPDLEKPHFKIDQVLRDFVGRLGSPALGNLQYGHVPRKLTIPFGIRARLNSERGEVQLLEAAVAA